MFNLIPASQGEGAVGVDGGVEAIERMEPASLEEEYAIR
jgi:hypothetical protein